MATILIAGCGYVGTLLGQNLVAAGHRVFALCRSAEGRESSSGLQWIATDLTQPDSLKDLPPSITHVVYAAAPGGGRDPERYERIYHQGVVNLCSQLHASNIERFIYVSSTGVYAQMDGNSVDEQSPTQASSDSARALLAAEQFLKESKFQQVVLRFSGIYGPGRIRMIRSVADPIPVKANLLDRYLNHIHQTDCAGAIEHLLFAASVEPLYLASDHQPTTRREMLLWLSERMGKPFPPEMESNTPPVRGGTHKQVSSALLRASGYIFQYPTFREGYDALLKENGYV